MNQSVKNILTDLIIPVSLILLAVFSRPFLPALEIAQTDVFAYLPLVLLSTTLLISWKFNQIEGFFLSLMLFIAYLGLIEIQQQATGVAPLYIAILSILLPLNFIFFKLLIVPSLFSASGIFRLFFIAAQSYGVLWLALNPNSPTFSAINTHIIHLQIWPDTFLPFAINMPHIATLLFSIIILIQVGFIFRHQTPLDSALLGAFIITFIACHLGNEAFIFFVSFSAVAIMLIVATIQTSYNMAFIDSLTALPSRRAMEDEIKKLGRRYSVAMLDIDHFKKLNDNYGHDVGDQVLRMVAKYIRRVGGGGRPARYGGEEFAVIFPGKTIIDAKPFLEIVRENIENARFALRDNKRPKKTPKKRSKRKSPTHEISVTISIGVAEKNRTQKTPLEVFQNADKALYKAKKQGRNRLCQ